MISEKNVPNQAKFLDMQAAVGVTKHAGGYAATDELLALCHIEHAHAVLNVGCGIGVGSIYIAKRYGCRVVGIDISEKMIAWSRQRASEEGVADKALAIRELGRVTKPGGYVGINEMFWLAEAPAALAPQVQAILGGD